MFMFTGEYELEKNIHIPADNIGRLDLLLCTANICTYKMSIYIHIYICISTYVIVRYVHT